MSPFARLKSLGRGPLAILVASVAGLAIGFVLVPRVASPDDPSVAPPAVELLGQRLPVNDAMTERAADILRRHVAGSFHVELPDGGSRVMSFGRLGAQLDKLRLSQLVRDVRDPTSPLRRTWRAGGSDGVLTLPAPLVLDPARAAEAVLSLKDELDHAPVDARLDLEKRTLVAEVEGRKLDLDATVAAFSDALSAGKMTASLVFLHKKPRRLAKDLGHVTVDQVLGFFETNYDRSQHAAARTYNLRLAASKLDGTVLLPGETFDFNEIVGPRDEANGYKVAPVIAEGEVVDGIGGGTCQISGTLHGAAFFAGLDIVERYPHTRPSAYIKMGLDATVVYPTIDFRIRNPFAFPIALHEVVKNGTVRAEVLGPSQPMTVTFIRRITDALPYEQLERDDDRLPRGERVLSQRGVPGFKLTRYRILRDGENAVREKWNDVYPPTTQIVRVGTGTMPKGSVLVADDAHPEYVADELLVMTQGPDVPPSSKEHDDRVTEDREPGRFGDAAWMEKAGMPVWKPKHDG
ncbi:MAG TPA: VanW family protein [Polyangiaceae bacterium]|jgi:vancomycin resistance protein YoaR|nr:VanW family protein [Polyangiaceae bacterium]